MALTARTQRRVGKTGLMIGLLIGAVFAAGPVLWMLSSSFKSNTQIFELPPRLVTDTFSFDAYIAIFTNPETMRFFLNSYIVAGSVTILTLIVAIQAAYAFSRFEFRGKRILNVVIVSVQAVPPITLLIPYFGLMVALGLYNSYAGLILTYMVFTLPYAIIMMTGYFNTLPKELDEAVRVDGAGSMTALWRILVPISVPGIVSVGIYTFMIAWNEYLFALTLTRTIDMRTVPIGIQLLMGQHSYEWNQIMAMSVLGSIPVLILFLFFQRYFISGLTAGSVKS
ncbi:MULTISPECIES: carbohydrate ABC transporter permease [Microbacterium]|uniref:Carbohydrate ABC transporter permease n=1 Tax=Microbacterium aurugineum TaxID=2851642 RepID=A0ABY4J0F7_9MICO|nr:MULTISPECIES: carbohydrate ABC transporter permease [Microbacterium]PKQ34493.1 MAG: sugar ABC transporter permease [Actinobacteria bacterium HGW-Actinobacteria-11]MCZ4299702.1 carbohydrate ABC transporter permease [Microbacterium oxydans]QEA28773.1 carbohydrate ABC transporter permease [Microbacterium sp. CBA3102]TCJ23289.1 carbohydrate ABC transporter permease [Microbacterium sp. PI-1]TFB17298.1 carbohydrate ABC transporter permease [Microbacterium sp. 3H14]